MIKRYLLLFLLCLFAVSLFVGKLACTADEGNKAPAAKPAATEAKAPAVKTPVTEAKAPAAKAQATEVKAPAAEKKVTPPAEVKIFSSLWKKHKKGAVIFSHEKHVKVHKIACTECHHIYKDGKNVWNECMPVKKCDECHTEATVRGEKRLSPELQKKNLKLAFHKNCIVCHKKMKRENPKTKAPTTCIKCHQKKKK